MALPAPPTAQPATQSSRTGAPDWLVFGAGLLLVGIVAEALYRADPKAGYGFVALVLIGYAGAQGRAQNVIAFGRQLGIITGGH